MPKISVIVPVYNTEKYLKKCFDSILNQTFQDFELIIVNDGSTDNSEEIITEYLSKNPDKIKIFNNINMGIAATRNFAINYVCGDYFIFVDSDDFIETDLLYKLNNLILNQPIDIIKYKMNVISEKFTAKINGPVFNATTGENAFNNLCFLDTLIDTPCLYLFNTNFFRMHHFLFANGKYHEDFGLIPLIIVQCKTFISADILGYNYIQVNNSITRNQDIKKLLNKEYDLFFHYDNMIQVITKINISQNTIDNIKQYYTNGILLSLKNLPRHHRKPFILKIKNQKMVKNIKTRNIRDWLKKLILNININLYLIIK